VRDIFAPKSTVQSEVTASPVRETEEKRARSDFDRFMNDRNSFVQTEAHDEVAAAPIASENNRPSRLIQSIRDAANKYESNSGQQTSATRERTQAPVNQEPVLNTRAKSIAEKLGFVNFDEDEFDTPSYLRKETYHSDEKAEVKPSVSRDYKNLDI
jgi:cell division protein FtsZ